MIITPRVSVIVPVFNGERTLRRCLDSVLAQRDAATLEVLVVDDGSTDASAAIAASYREVRVIAQANAGPAAARNRGIRAATGELLAFNDADDAWLAGGLAAQLAELDADPELDFALCNSEDVPDVGFAAPTWAFREAPGMPGFILPAMLARRGVFERVGLFDESMRLAEDTDWFLRARDVGIKAACLALVGVRRYAHDGNLSAQISHSHRGLVKAIYASAVRRRMNQLGR